MADKLVIIEEHLAEVEQLIKQKHLPGQHDQASHGRGRMGGKPQTASYKEPYRLSFTGTHREHAAGIILSDFKDAVLSNQGTIKKWESEDKYTNQDHISLYYGETEVARYTYGRHYKAGSSFTTYNQMVAAEKFMKNFRATVNKRKREYIKTTAKKGSGKQVRQKHLPGEHDQASHGHGHGGMAYGKKLRPQKEREAIAKTNMQAAKGLQDRMLSLAKDYGQRPGGRHNVEALPLSIRTDGFASAKIKFSNAAQADEFLGKLKASNKDADIEVKQRESYLTGFYSSSFVVEGKIRGLKSVDFAD